MILDYKDFTDLIEQFAGELPELLASHHRTRDLAPRVQRLLEFAETRFTLAVVGQMRAGKSSLLNALIGANLAPVGVNETTATINWFTYGTGESTQRFRVHWRGRPPEEKSLSDRGQWSGESSLAGETRKLEFFADTEFLRTADVVDTPGTRSLLTAHQEKIDEFLAKKADDETRDLGSKADAILYVVMPVGRQSDSDLLENFQKSTRLPNSPSHNSLAVVHKWETLESEDPHAEACSKAQRIFEAMGDFVTAVLPVSAPLGWAAEHFPEPFWDSVLNIAINTTKTDFEDLLADARDFDENEASGCPMDVANRRRLRQEFKLPWPCLKVVFNMARHRAPGNSSDLRQIILETSGLVHLRDTIHNRFFARSRVLKMSKILNAAWEPCAQAQRVLRSYKQDIDQDFDKARRAKLALAEHIKHGDSELVPAQEFIQSAVGKLEEDQKHVSENLLEVGSIMLKVKDAHEQMERDLSMLDLLDESVNGLDSKTLKMLRYLFGRFGPNVEARLLFFKDLGKAAVSTADVDEAIGGLRSFQRHVSGKMRAVTGHGVDRLEQIANWMEEKNIPMIPLGNTYGPNDTP